MKTKTTLIVLAVLLCINLQAQENQTGNGTKKEAIRTFGIGLKTFNLLSDVNLSSNVVPGNKIIMTLNVIQYLRIQVEYGMFSTKQFSKLVNDDLHMKNNSIGIGIYGMLPKDKTILYGGVKYVSTSETQEDVKYESNPNPPYNPIYSIMNEKTTGSGLGFVLGGEYFLSQHFSLGTEVGFQSIKNTSKSSESSEEIENSSVMTETNFLLRFYF